MIRDSDERNGLADYIMERVEDQVVRTKELTPTKLQDLFPTVGTFDELTEGIDGMTARWYKGSSEYSHYSVAETYINATVRDILREYAEERLAKGIKGIPQFVPGPIGAAPRYTRVFSWSKSERDDYHRKEREGNRKLMLELRARNDASLAALLEGWR